MTKRTFGVLACALVMLGFGLLCENRYRIAAAGPLNAFVVKLDTWTGRTWIQRPASNQWQEVVDAKPRPTAGDAEEPSRFGGVPVR